MDVLVADRVAVDLILGAVAWFLEQLTSMSLQSVLLLSALACVLPPLGTLMHEVGHAWAASQRGVPIRQIVAAGEGPALTFTVRGIDVRVGLGLGRDLRSRDPLGFVELGPALTSRDAIAILIAGPKAQALYGVVLLALTVAPLPGLFRWTVGLAGAEALILAISNAAPSSKGTSDGALIKAIRAELRQLAESPSTPSPHAGTSVAPPRHG